MYIESRVKRSALVIVVVIATFIAVAYNGIGEAIFPDKIQTTYRADEINREVDQVLIIEFGKMLRLDDFGSSYSVMAHKALATDNYTVWAIKNDQQIPIKTAQWLILDTCEVRLSDESEFKPGTVTLIVRTLGD